MPPIACLIANEQIYELIVVDLSVSIDLNVLDELINLVRLELLAEVAENLTKFSLQDGSATVLVEGFEGLAHVALLIDGLLELTGLEDIEGSITVYRGLLASEFLNQGLDLGLQRVAI
jgi:hypothetical protein